MTAKKTEKPQITREQENTEPPDNPLGEGGQGKLHHTAAAHRQVIQLPWYPVTSGFPNMPFMAGLPEPEPSSRLKVSLWLQIQRT